MDTNINKNTKKSDKITNNTKKIPKNDKVSVDHESTQNNLEIEALTYDNVDIKTAINDISSFLNNNVIETSGNNKI